MTRLRAMLLVLAAAPALACGARSGLDVESCNDAGTRPCETACGRGLQACVEGRWQACDVPPATRACTNDCGEGTQTCVDRRWGDCRVPPAEVPCTGPCGAGVARCADGVVGACSVATTTLPCTNACGGGSLDCVDGVMGPCVVPPGEVPCTNDCGSGLAFCADGVISACAVPVSVRPCSTACGTGTQECVDGEWGRCSAMRPLPPVLSVRVRDFHDTHPDFENALATDRGIVEATLGADDKPVYAGPTPTTSGRANFDQWYRDVPGVNAGTAIDLSLVPSAGDPDLFVYDDLTFFPIDGMLFGNEGRPHNYHFTLEASAEFVYAGGEIFRFRGDDDVFVFIDRRLAIDLGGVHGRQEATVDLDSIAASFGLVRGNRYPLHLFFAERHTTESTFTVETTLADSIRCE